MFKACISCKFRQLLTGVQLRGMTALCREVDAAMLCLEESFFLR